MEWVLKRSLHVPWSVFFMETLVGRRASFRIALLIESCQWFESFVFLVCLCSIFFHMTSRSLRRFIATLCWFWFQEPQIFAGDPVLTGTFHFVLSAAVATTKLLYFQLDCSFEFSFHVLCLACSSCNACAVSVVGWGMEFAVGDRDGCWSCTQWWMVVVLQYFETDVAAPSSCHAPPPRSPSWVLRTARHFVIGLFFWVAGELFIWILELQEPKIWALCGFFFFFFDQFVSFLKLPRPCWVQCCDRVLCFHGLAVWGDSCCCACHFETHRRLLMVTSQVVLFQSVWIFWCHAVLWVDLRPAEFEVFRVYSSEFLLRCAQQHAWWSISAVDSIVWQVFHEHPIHPVERQKHLKRVCWKNEK